MIQHLACMMDGNRRWARKQGWAAITGHSHGIDAVRRTVEFCLKNKIPYLSLYTLSIENLKRSHEEKSALFSLALSQTTGIFQELLENNVRVRFVGDRSLFPDSLKTSFADIEQKTAHCTALHLNFLFCYGARQEIVAGVKDVVRKVQDGSLDIATLTEESFKQHLWLGAIPDPEIVVRTGGMNRVSNFMLYQSAYSEYYFLDCLWPELTQQDLENVVTDFMNRQRNFGT